MAEHFSPETIDFLWGLRFNNEKPWFEAHRAEYEAYLQEPIRTLGRRVFDALDEALPGENLRLHIARIYRDARRLYGRGPFKENLWFSIEQHSTEQAPMPGFYFSIGPEHYGYGMGFFDARAAAMQVYRQEIDRAPAQALALAERFAAQDTFVLEGPVYARPKGHPGGLLDDWYNRRSLSLNFESAPDAGLFDPALAERILEGYRFLTPYYQWLQGIASRAAADGLDDRT